MTTIEANLLARYTNGNYTITIYDDGTKVREYDEEPLPVYPESIDLKITNFCDAGCKYCHESSTIKGRHARIDDIMHAVDGLPFGTELAIGGGNPLSHPNLKTILREFKNRGLISNMTINGSHVGLNSSGHDRFNREFHDYKDLVYGIGISAPGNKHYYMNLPYNDRREIMHLGLDNVVLHAIVGIDDISSLINLGDDVKMLILGYKQFGFGIKYMDDSEVREHIKKWRYWLPTLLRGSKVSFDNLAIEQLRIRELVGDDIFNERYMGDDGHFTMYIDAVLNKFAKSSTSARMNIGDMNIKEMFKTIRQQCGCN